MHCRLQKGRRYEVRDTVLLGLHIRVSAKGGKVWHLATRIKLLAYPVVSLAGARQRARGDDADARRHDPSIHRSARPAPHEGLEGNADRAPALEEAARQADQLERTRRRRTRAQGDGSQSASRCIVQTHPE